MNAVATIAKAAVLFFIRKYAAGLVFDIVVETAEKLAKKTDTEIDDNAVAQIKADKQEFIAALKGFI